MGSGALELGQALEATRTPLVGGGVAGVRKPLISASRLLEIGHKLVLDGKLRIQCRHHSAGEDR